MTWVKEQNARTTLTGYEESAGCGMSATSLRSVLILGIKDTCE